MENKGLIVWKDVLKIGGAYAAFCIGSGFATGQEIMQFFTAHGWAGIGAAFITLVLYIWMGMTMMKEGHQHHLDTDTAVWNHFCGKYMGVVMNCFGSFVVFGIYVVMIGGAGASMEQYLGIPNIAGRLIMSAACLIVALMGLNKLVDILGFIGPVIIVCALAIGLITIVRDSSQISMIQESLSQVEVPATSGNWIVSGFLYAGFMAFMIIPFMTQLGSSSRVSLHSGMAGGAAGAIFQVIAIIIMLIAQLLNITMIHDSQIPSLMLAEKISPVLAGVFVVIVLLGIFSTAMPLLWMLAHKAGADRSRKFNVTTVLLVVAAVVLSVLPFTVLVNKIYGISGYVGIAAIAIAFGRQIWMRSVRKSRNVKKSRAAASSK